MVPDRDALSEARTSDHVIFASPWNRRTITSALTREKQCHRDLSSWELPGPKSLLGAIVLAAPDALCVLQFVVKPEGLGTPLARLAGVALIALGIACLPLGPQSLRSLDRRALVVADTLESGDHGRRASTDRRSSPGPSGSSRRERKWRRVLLRRCSRLRPSAKPEDLSVSQRANAEP